MIFRTLWQRVRVTERDVARTSRGFWLQFAAGRFPEIKNAGELIQVAHQFYDYHQNGEAPAE